MNSTDIFAKTGLKCTKQRLAVLNALKSAASPMSAEQIYEKVNKMSLSTVYRILDCFCENGIASGESIYNSAEMYYTLADNTHRHYAICLGCNKMSYVEICPIHNMRVDDFTVTGHKLELYGYCSDCLKQM